ncbi:MAG TPA: hypothetical protein VGM06_17610 [Polyangiaceae bacterium]|jgi:hypothetical protein
MSFQVRQEEDWIASRRIVGAALGWTLLGALGVVAAGLILVATSGSLRPSAAGPTGPAPGGVRISGIEQTPIWDARDGLDLRARQRAELDAWGWADRDAGIARVPIGYAIDLVSAEDTP